jgi:hypothetical protein
VDCLEESPDSNQKPSCDGPKGESSKWYELISTAGSLTFGHAAIRARCFKPSRTLQIHTGHNCTTQVRTPQIRTPQIRIPKVRVPQIRATQVNTVQVRTTQIRTTQIRTTQVCATQVRKLQVPSFPIGHPDRAPSGAARDVHRIFMRKLAFNSSNLDRLLFITWPNLADERV